MAKTTTRKIKVLAVDRFAVRSKILGLGIIAWLPRSQVTFPRGIQRGDEVEVAIPDWIVRNEIGEPC